MPASASSNWQRGIFPTRAVSICWSMLMIGETLATESLGNAVQCAASWTFPGAKAHLKLLVRATQTTLPIQLWFQLSP